MPTAAQPRSLSALLEDLSVSLGNSEKATVGTIVEALHERGLGAMVLIFSIPLALPTFVPGINTIFALPLLPLTAQQALGRHTVWMPQKFLKKELPPGMMAEMIRTALPWLKKLEILIKPRLEWVTHGRVFQIFGVMSLIMAAAATLPVPLTNTVPGIGIGIMALGTMMRDGLAVIAGAVIGMGWLIMLVVALAVFGPEAFNIVKEAIHAVF